MKSPREATFSACFGAAFLVWHPTKYAELLADKMKHHQADAWLINVFGVSLLIGRVFHIKGMIGKRFKYRVVGMHITIYALIGLSLVNMVYVPFDKFV